jgi:hypothetical protein
MISVRFPITCDTSSPDRRHLDVYNALPRADAKLEQDRYQPSEWWMANNQQITMCYVAGGRQSETGNVLGVATHDYVRTN